MPFYSLRMRSSQGGIHISGGERLISKDQVNETAVSLIQRAFNHERGDIDFINITIEKIKRQEIHAIQALPIRTFFVRSVQEGHHAAKKLLVDAGVSLAVAENAIELLKRGPGPQGKVMRGAVLMDAQTGVRLETDPARGVRVSRFDWKEEVLRQWCECVAPFGLNRSRIWEALALASKVASAPGIVAELCWSDDPSYVTGYVASSRLGYVRIPHLKENKDPMGGRVFFVHTKNIQWNDLIYYLEKTPVFISYLPKNIVEKSIHS